MNFQPQEPHYRKDTYVALAIAAAILLVVIVAWMLGSQGDVVPQN
jgi:hypothetical protein